MTQTKEYYKQWRDANNHGVWWIKFMIMEGVTELDENGNEITWPETWHTEIVSITVSSSNGLKHLIQEVKGEIPDYSGIRLHASGGHNTMRCSLGDASRIFQVEDLRRKKAKVKKSRELFNIRKNFEKKRKERLKRINKRKRNKRR